jgi:toxin CcdB
LRQFDVFQNPSIRWRPVAPFVVVLQSHLLNAAPTAVVAPLLIDDGRSAFPEASVVLTFQGDSYILSVPEMAGVDLGYLRDVRGSVAEHEYEIRRALDRLFTGF